MSSVSRFLANAGSIFETARSAAAGGLTPSDMTIAIGRNGHISMISGSEWSLETLAVERDAAMVYRVTRQNGQVRVEGRSGLEKCVLEGNKPAAAARTLLTDSVRYMLVDAARALPAPL